MGFAVRAWRVFECVEGQDQRELFEIVFLGVVGVFALRRRYRTVARTDFHKNSTFAGPCRRLGVLGVPGCRRLLVLLPVFPGNTKKTAVKAAASGEPDPPNQKDVSTNLRVALF